MEEYNDAEESSGPLGWCRNGALAVQAHLKRYESVPDVEDSDHKPVRGVLAVRCARRHAQPPRLLMQHGRWPAHGVMRTLRVGLLGMTLECARGRDAKELTLGRSALVSMRSACLRAVGFLCSASNTRLAGRGLGNQLRGAE